MPVFFLFFFLLTHFAHFLIDIVVTESFRSKVSQSHSPIFSDLLTEMI